MHAVDLSWSVYRYGSTVDRRKVDLYRYSTCMTYARLEYLPEDGRIGTALDTAADRSKLAAFEALEKRVVRARGILVDR